MTVTAPLANPTATCVRSSVAAKAEIFPNASQSQLRFKSPSAPNIGPTGKGFFPLLIATVLRHVGSPVFLTGLSSAQTFRTGWCSPPPSYTHQNISHTGSTAPSTPLHEQTYRNCNQQARPVHLPHVRDAHPRRRTAKSSRRRRIIRAEAAHHLPAGSNNAHGTIVSAEEETVGT